MRLVVNPRKQPGRSGTKRGIVKLRFGLWRIPLSRAEMTALERAIDCHVRQFGLVHGFIRRLLNGDYRDV